MSAPTLFEVPSWINGDELRQPRGRRRVALVMVAILLPIPWAWFLRVGHVSDGTVILPEPGSNQTSVTISQVYAGSTLRRGDVVTAVDGIGLDKWAAVAEPPARRRGQTLRYTVIRRGDTRTVSVRLIDYPFTGALAQTGVLLVLVVFLLALSTAVFLLRPFDPAAQAMFLVGAALPLVIPEYPLGVQVIDLAGGSGFIGYVGADLAAAVFWGALLYFALVFPQPIGPIRRRPRVALLSLLLPLMLWVLSWAWVLPLAHTGLDQLFAWTTVSVTASRVIPVLAAAFLLRSYRTTTDPDIRRRLRWIMTSLVIGLGGYLGLGAVPSALTGAPIVGYQWLLLLMLPAPLTVAAAILRYRLFDIEIILTRSLLAGILTGGAAGAYAAAILVLPETRIGSSTLATLLIGSLIAVAALTARRRLAAWITTLVYGERNDPHAVMSRLSTLSTLDTAATADSVLPDVVQTLATALRLPFVRLQLLAPDGTVEAEAAAGTRTGTVTPTVLPIGSENGEPLASLELDVGAGREPFGPADQRLLQELSQRLTGAVRTLLLARALQRSRERLVLAREEERRRLQRDLHDGIGPVLAAQGMQLEVTGRLVRRDPAAAEANIETLRQASATLIAEIRRIVEDLRPPVLDQLGLVSAIREHVRAFNGVHGEDHPDGFWVTVEANGDLGHLPAAVEVAAFRIAVEAVTNAARYSHGSVCTVRLRRDGDLHLTVADDGAGPGPQVAGTGVGVGSMRERAHELGGGFAFGPAPDGGGTAVVVRLPVDEGGGHDR